MAKRKAPLEGATGQTPGGSLTGKSLSWRQEQFVEYYVKNGGNATQAALSAGYPRSSAYQRGYELVKKSDILKAIEDERDRLKIGAKFDRSDAIKILVSLATTTPDQVMVALNKPYSRTRYKGLGDKKLAICVERTPDGYIASTPSASERRAATNDLWEKLGLGDRTTKENWIDGLAELLLASGRTKAS